MVKRKLIGRGQVTIQDYTDSKTILAYIGSTLQRQVIYEPNEGAYNPDYGVTPIELVAELYVAGDTSNRIGSAKSIKWYKQVDSMGELVEVETGSTYQKSGETLKITRNVLRDNTSMVYQAKIVYPIGNADGTEEDMIVNTSIELIKLSSGSKGSDGEDAVYTILDLPEGDTIRNHNYNLRIDLKMYKGVNEVTPTKITWYQMDPTAEDDGYGGKGWREIQGTQEKNNTIVIYPEMFSGVGTYQVIAEYGGQTYRDTTTVKDIVDTTVNIIGPSAFKNGKGTIKLTAKVYSVGEEVDTEGELYNYVWSSYNTQGEYIEGFKKEGKTIELNAEEVDNIVNLQCMVTKTSRSSWIKMLEKVQRWTDPYIGDKSWKEWVK